MTSSVSSGSRGSDPISGNCTNRLDNTPVQYNENVLLVKLKKVFGKILIFFLIFAQNIDGGHTLEPPRRGGSNEYPQSMFLSKNKKKSIPPRTQFCYIKVEFKGYTLHGHVFVVSLNFEGKTHLKIFPRV